MISEYKTPKITSPFNPVKEKSRVGGPNAVNSIILKKAEEAIIAMTPQYLEWVRKDLENIQKCYYKLKLSDLSDEEALKEIFLIAHDMKGQGGTFGFDLITTIGDQLCRIIDNINYVRDDELDAIKVHIDALKLIIKDQMLGDGGTEGNKILVGLDKVSKKIRG